MMFSPLSASFLFFTFISFTHALDFNIIQQMQECPYTLVIMTSCLSPETTIDEITIAFGDADGNKVTTKKLWGRKGLEKFSSTTLQTTGQCMNNPICFLDINRAGPDGWLPESIEVYSEGAKSVKFDFSESDPKKVSYSLNNCSSTTPAIPPPPPETPSIPPPTPPKPTPPRPSGASRRGDGVSVFFGFVLVTAIAAMVCEELLVNELMLG